MNFTDVPELKKIPPRHEYVARRLYGSHPAATYSRLGHYFSPPLSLAGNTFFISICLWTLLPFAVIIHAALTLVLFLLTSLTFLHPSYTRRLKKKKKKMERIIIFLAATSSSRSPLILHPLLTTSPLALRLHLVFPSMQKAYA